MRLRGQTPHLVPFLQLPTESPLLAVRHTFFLPDLTPFAFTPTQTHRQQHRNEQPQTSPRSSPPPALSPAHPRVLRSNPWAVEKWSRENTSSPLEEPCPRLLAWRGIRARRPPNTRPTWTLSVPRTTTSSRKWKSCTGGGRGFWYAVGVLQQAVRLLSLLVLVVVQRGGVHRHGAGFEGGGDSQGGCKILGLGSRAFTSCVERGLSRETPCLG